MGAVVKSNPKAIGIREKWGSIVAYLTSSDVPLRKRAIILGGILWVILPDPILGPIDDFVVSMALLPWLDSELKRFASGHYSKAPTSATGSTDVSPSDLIPSNATTDRPQAYPFLISDEELERY